MALEKQSVAINFSQGLDTKSDPFQIAIGKFLILENSVFQTGASLKKRNGFKRLADLPVTEAQTVTTFNGGLVALDSTLYALSDSTNVWTNAGPLRTVEVSTIPAVRSSSSQTTVDTAVSESGLACSAWLDSNGFSYYQITDAATGQIIVPAVRLEDNASMPRAFVLGNYFIVTILNVITGTPHLQYIAISLMDPSVATAITNISSVVSGNDAAYDGFVANNNLYLSYNASDSGGAIRTLYLDSQLIQHSTVVLAGQTADLMSVTADITGSTPVIWVTWWDESANEGKTAAYTQALVTVLAPTLVTSSTPPFRCITTVAQDETLNLFVDLIVTYSYSLVETDFIGTIRVDQSGTVSGGSFVRSGVGLGSKAFIANDNIYVYAVYAGSLQPTLFLLAQEEDPNELYSITAKIAYSNTGGFAINQILPSVNVTDDIITSVGYLIKDLLVSVSKDMDSPDSSNIYTQNGINIATVALEVKTNSAEIASDLHLSGGFLQMYDGAAPVEHGFHVFPEDIVVTTSTSGGSLSAQEYFYQVTYEWTDAQGNLHRSAPSVPVSITTTGATSSNTVNIPTLRLTSKVDVRIVIYRWSQAQQNFYQITSITDPIINNEGDNQTAYVDTDADADILGNVLLYTTGGVLENIAAPACTLFTLSKSRLFLVDDENRNTIWYSKLVIQGVPVEMSDAQTISLQPTIGGQANTGVITALSAMDDKVIPFKANAIYYFTGDGPDATGANNTFSEPTFVTSTVGCSNQRSIVQTPLGLMFQSGTKGIWLLGRDLSTKYIGAPVERYNAATVLSAVNVPGTNQIRFTMSTGITLMYDYYYDQWGTFTNIPALSSTIYQNLHTYLNSYGQILQENPGVYLDDAKPVLMSFTTGWLNVAGLQGFERAYALYVLATYFTPHKLSVQIAYDYNSSPSQISTIVPDNFGPAYGGDSLYGGGSPYGGAGNIEQWRVFMQKQKCEAFQVTITESFDNSFGVLPGKGLILSGMELLVGLKSRYPRLKAARSVG